MSSHYSTDYSRFKDIVDSDEEDEEKPGAEEEEAASADDAVSASGSDSDSLPDLLEGDEAEDPAVEAAAAQWCAPAVVAEPLPPPAPEPGAEGDMPSWMAPEEPTAEAPPALAEPVDAADDSASHPVTPDEEDSPAFTDDEDK